MSVTKNATKLNAKANRCKVISWTPFGVYRILSPSGGKYTVDLGRGGICSCAWGEKGNAGCSHEMCARKHWERLHEGRAASFQAGEPEAVARRQHKATKPVAAQGANAVSLVLRDRVDEVAAIDAEIDELGKALTAARHTWYMHGGGQVKADAGAEMDRLRSIIMRKTREREAKVVVRRMA